MKKFILPLFLISFSVVTLGFVHIDNINKLEEDFYKLRTKHQTELNSQAQTPITTSTTSEI